ncbi:MAG: lysophospholipid acyltransferase family protein [bacterium]|nr:1-acyl-sn-glycerol-3-phosphate acyltransferase [Myxococcales bacterium]MCB9543971.1 1-acyl-sn-glycerol-3-phosphate acyltransferase [Myxococcales bacterium]MCB9552132.1 1-acyl-sn-glycerol-3-phosphate acyltransferase [Myxococcales bacterium]
MKQTLLSIWAWACISIIIIVGFFIFLVVRLVTWPFDRDSLIVGRMWRLSGVLASKLNPLWRFRVHGELPRRRPEGMVVVSNHRSQADPFLISHLPWEMKWLSKAIVFRIPFVGWSMRMAGDIPVNRGMRDSARAAMSRCAEYLKRGVPVMIFPEGTRSKVPEMLPFKDGAFRLAIEMQAAILPLAVAGTGTALPKHDWRFGRAEAWVTVGEPIPTRGMTLDDLDTLKALARERIEALLDRVTPLATRNPPKG